MKRQIQRLVLSRETLRELADLDSVVAAARFSSPPRVTCPECANSVYATCDC